MLAEPSVSGGNRFINRLGPTTSHCCEALDNAQQAAKLNRQIGFTDGLIDQIVYRPYDLTEEEVAVVVEGKR